LRRAIRFWPTGCCARVGSIPLAFYDAEQEASFRLRQTIRLRKVMRRIGAVALAVHILAVLLELAAIDFQNMTAGAACFLGLMSIVAITSCLMMLKMPERMIPILFVLGCAGVLGTSRSRAALLAGESVHVAFENISSLGIVGQCSLTSDAVVIGNLACLIVVYFVVLPVRAVVSACLVPVFPLMYVVFTLMLPVGERDGSQARTITLGFRLLICSAVGLIGRCYIEVGERLASLRVQKVQQDLTKEKVLRFAAEHSLEKGPFASEAFPAAEAGTAVSTTAPGESPGQAIQSDAHETNSFRGSVMSHPLSSIIFTPSDTRDLPVGMQLAAMKAVAAEEKWLIDWSDVTFSTSLIGKGGYAVVVEGKLAGARVAMKMPAKEHLSSSKEIADFFGKELRVLRHLRHPFIVNFYGACIEESKHLVVLVEEFVDGASLHDTVLVKKDVQLSEDTRWQILDSVSHALSYLHGQGPTILHGDLSAKNIMLRAGSFEPVLIDFGMAVLQKSRSKIQGGSPRWMAPELIRSLDEGGLTPDCSVDIFAFGRIAFFIATGSLPLSGYTVEDLIAACSGGNLPQMEWPSEEASPLALFCKEELCPVCVAPKPGSRCTAEEANNLLRKHRQGKEPDSMAMAESVLLPTGSSSRPRQMMKL